MRVAYVTTYDARNILNWSGLGTFIARALIYAGIELDYVDVGPIPFGARAAAELLSRAIRRNIALDREPYFARRWSSAASAAFRPGTDVAFSPGSIPLAFLPGATPRAFWTDATFAAAVDFYPRGKGLHPRTIRNANALEQKALDECGAAIYSSDWAAASAVNDYGTDPKKVHVLPFGANFPSVPDVWDLERFFALREGPLCRLLFIGVDWRRKGGPLTVETARLLNQGGIETELTVIGVDAPAEPFVRSLGFLSKAAHLRALTAAYERAHFFMMPSRAEASGVVYAEASAFGVPSLATDVGGVATMVHHGVNGHLFPREAGPEAYAEYIASALPRHEELARSAFADYRERLDWEVNGRRAREILEGIAAQPA